MKDISRFVELVDANIWDIQLSEIPQQLYIGVQDGYCNLKCPMCFMHSTSNPHADPSKFKGIMPLKKFCKILDEVEGSNTTINPYRFTEPLLISNLRECIIETKKRDLAIALDTNGLLLTKKMAEFFVLNGLDSITFSIDAMTNDTLEKTRGVRQIEKIKAAVFMMLKAREGHFSPRIGVSFVESKFNRHERQDFVDYWIDHVDVVRVNKVFDRSKVIKGIRVPEKRFPCYALYSKMVINFNGDVTICTTDAFDETKVGNVFTDGVKNIWNGHRLNAVRQNHETGRFDRLPFCRTCNLWADSSYEDVEENGILTRRSQSVTYYNRVDRMDTWSLQQKGRSSNVKA